MVVFRVRMLVYKEQLLKWHYADWWHGAVAFRVFMQGVLIVVAYAVTYAGEDMWKKLGWYREQPAVQYKYEFLAALEMVDTTCFNSAPTTATGGQCMGEAAKVKTYSSFGYLNDVAMAGDTFAAMDFGVSEEDEDRDGKVDEINVYLSYERGASDPPIFGLKLALMFDYVLSVRSQVKMEGLVIISESGGVPGSSVYVDGDLQLRQSYPFLDGGVYEGHDFPFVDRTYYGPADNVTFAKLAEANRDRGYSTYLGDKHAVWNAGAGGQFTAHIKIRVRDQLVLFKPSDLGVFKFAWVQFLATWAFFWFFVSMFEDFVFRMNVFETRIFSDAPPASKTKRF